MGEKMSNLIDYMVELGLDAIKDNVMDIKDQREIRKRLQTFIEKQSKINELSTIAEEIDFQGLVEYITGNLLDNVKVRFFGKRKERQIARETIINKAVAYSQVSTEPAKKRVVKLISNVLNILREFYRRKVPKSELFVATEIVDNIEDVVKEQLTEQNKRIIYGVSAMIKEAKCHSIMSVDNNIQLTKLGKLQDVESNLSSLFRCIGSEHVLYPYYGYAPEVINGEVRLLSKPLTADAIRKFPPKIKCKGSIKLGGQKLDKFSVDTIDYANRHQIPITISIQEAKKLLGDIDDPVQQEAEALIGKNLEIPPKPFPESFPCSILLDGNVEFEYILLRTQEILEDGTIVVSNREQEKCRFKISMRINIAEKKTDFNINIEEPSNRETLQYLRFMKKASDGAKLIIRELPTGQNLMEGIINQFEYKSGFQTTDEEIAFLEKVVLIEDYFGMTIILPDEICTDDYDIICYMSELINGERYNGSWSKAEFSFELNEDLQKKIAEMEDSQYSISYVGSIDIPLYGEQYHFPIKRTYERVKVNNLQKLKRKAEILDVGDIIKIEYLPGEENGIGSYADMLHTELNIEIKKEE